MAQNDDGQTVYVVRMNIPGVAAIEYGLRNNRIAVGYSEAPGLIEIASDQYAIREAIKDEYGWNNPQAGQKARHLRLFLDKMNKGDLALVPDGSEIHLASVAGPPIESRSDGVGYYRDVKWLNKYPRAGLPSDVQNRLKYTWGTCREVKDILELVLAIEAGNIKTDKTFQESLREHLANEALERLLKGNMNEKHFESFLRTLFEHRFSATGSGRSGASDKGADVVLELPQPEPLPTLRVAIQAKYHIPEVGPEAVDQILKGMEHETAHLGLVVTTGEFSEKAFEKASDESASIVLVDGQMLARMIVDFS